MSEMKPIVKKVLQSGLVDKSMVELFEKWGNLPAGSSELVNDDALKNATKEHLYKLAEEIGTEVDKERTLKETQLDLDKLRWPKTVSIARNLEEGGTELLQEDIVVMVDRMGRYYFRPEDVEESTLVPGRLLLVKQKPVSNGPFVHPALKQQILEVSPLYIGESLVCFQVSVA